MKLKTIAVVMLMALAAPVALPADEKDDKSNTTDTITMAELRDHMYYLASDELGGRIWNKPGYRMAADYAVSQFRAAGIKPLLKDENGKPTYLQKVVIIEKGYKDSALWTLKTGENTQTFKAGEMIRSGQLGSILNSSVNNFYYIGFGISEPDHGWDDLKGIDLKDKTVVLNMGTPLKNGKPLLPEKVNKKYLGLQGLGAKLTALKKKGAGSVIILCDDELQKFWDSILDSLLTKTKNLTKKAKKKADNSMSLVIHQDLAKSLFQGREYSPYNKDIMKGYKTFPLKDLSISLKAERTENEVYTWNVLGMLPGSDESLKDEYVVLAAHLDHISPQNGEVCNGADDNASGSIAVIEAGEALAKKKNKRSIILGLWSAEEIGLFGSQYFVRHSPIDLNKIKVNVNLDMIARTDKKNAENRAIYCLGTHSGSPAFKKFIEKVNTDSINWPLNTEKNQFGDASDNAAFTAKGIPAVFFFSGIHQDYHRPTDDPEKLDWEKFLNVARLACRLTDELANTDTSLESFKKTTAEK